MAGPPAYHCGMCERSFSAKAPLQQHMRHHEEVKQTAVCEVCGRTFDDKLALESHHIAAGHGSRSNYRCHRCKEYFPTATAVTRHQNFPSPCSDAFAKDKKKRRDPKNEQLVNTNLLALDYGAPVLEPAAPRQYSNIRIEPSPESHNSMNYDGIFCDICKKTFNSMARYDMHWLSCDLPRQTAVQATFPATKKPGSLIKEPFGHRAKSEATTVSTIPQRCE